MGVGDEALDGVGIGCFEDWVGWGTGWLGEVEVGKDRFQTRALVFDL